MSEHEIHWKIAQVPQPPKRHTQDVDAQDAGSSKRVKTGMTYQGKQICKRRNDARGCNDPNCPNEHRCDVLVNDKVCGSTQHTRLTCPYRK